MFFDNSRKFIIIKWVKTTGINQNKRFIVICYIQIIPVSGNAWKVIDYRYIFFCQLIKKCRLSHIRSAYYRNYGYHLNSFNKLLSVFMAASCSADFLFLPIPFSYLMLLIITTDSNCLI